MPFLLLLLENHQIVWWILGVVVVTAMWVLIAFTSFNKGLKKIQLWLSYGWKIINKNFRKI